MMRVCFQGEHGAYSEMAVCEHYGAGEVETIPCETFNDVFKCVLDGVCDCGFIPVENSVAGSIHQNYDLLLAYPLSVIGEHYARISHCLIGLPGTEITDLRKVISHPQALAQCAAYLHSLPHVQVEPVYDTAGSVRLVRQTNDRTMAAIASRRAATLYDMNIIAERIEDDPANSTRFQIIARQGISPGDDAKTSIVFSLHNQPGSLYRAMSVFALRGIDLTKIESRPLVGKQWEYYFYIDFTGGLGSPVVERALANLEEFTTFLRVLGSYPRQPH